MIQCALCEKTGDGWLTFQTSGWTKLGPLAHLDDMVLYACPEHRTILATFIRMPKDWLLNLTKIRDLLVTSPEEETSLKRDAYYQGYADALAWVKKTTEDRLAAAPQSAPTKRRKT